MAKLTVDELKRHLKTYEREELVKLVTDLSKLSKKAQKHLVSEVREEKAVQSLYEETKRTVKELVSPEGENSRPRLSKAKKAIDNFKKSTGNQQLTVDLMLSFVEEGTEYAKTHDDLDERFYSRMSAMYSEAADEFEKDELLFHQFNIRTHSILEAAVPIGTEYPATLTDIYHSISWVEDEE